MVRLYTIHGWMFLLHRITGVALLAYFVAHVLAISTAMLAGPDAFASVMGTFRQPPFRAVEVAVVGCILFHGLNGLHLIAAERGWMRPAGTAFPRATVAATLAIWLGAAAMAVAR